jgi:hypothetical protein
MLNVTLCLLTLAQLFPQTDAGTCVRSTSVLDKNSTGSVELELDDGKPLPNFPNHKYPPHSLERDTNPQNGTRTDLQPAAVQPVAIEGVHHFSRTSPSAVGMNMFETTSTIPTIASMVHVSGHVSGRKFFVGKGLGHCGFGPEFKNSLNDANGRAFNADVKIDVTDARLSGEKVYGNKSETFLNLERNHPDEIKNEENRKVVQESKSILPIDEDACTFDLTSKNQKNVNIGLDEKILDRDVLDHQISSVLVLEHPDDKEELCYCGAVTELEYSSISACQDHSFVVTITAATKEVSKDMYLIL